jgi:acyl-CoA thioesterase
MTTEFDDDTALERGEDGRWHGRVTDRWWIGAGPNGGYIASFLIRAMVAEAAQPDPLTMTTHYLARPEVAPVTVAVETLHSGRSHQFLHARLLQDGVPVAVSTATFGRLREGDPISMQGEIPAWPGLPEAVVGENEPVPGMTFRERFEYRSGDPNGMPFLRTEPGPAHVGGWMRFADGRRLDPLAIPLFMDSWPPPMFATFLGGGAPTIELTVHWRNRPRTEWHLADFRSRFLLNGYTEEDGELWDEDGRLIAQSRQLARFAPPT